MTQVYLGTKENFFFRQKYSVFQKQVLIVRKGNEYYYHRQLILANGHNSFK